MQTRMFFFLFAISYQILETNADIFNKVCLQKGCSRLYVYCSNIFNVQKIEVSDSPLFRVSVHKNILLCERKRLEYINLNKI